MEQEYLISKILVTQGRISSWLRFLPDPGVPGVWSMVLGVCLQVQDLWIFADVTLADYDTNSILTDDGRH